MYRIMGRYRGTWEILDTSKDLEEARTLESEYRLAFRGQGWVIEIRDNGGKV